MELDYLKLSRRFAHVQRTLKIFPIMLKCLRDKHVSLHKSDNPDDNYGQYFLNPKPGCMVYTHFREVGAEAMAAKRDEHDVPSTSLTATVLLLGHYDLGSSLRFKDSTVPQVG